MLILGALPVCFIFDLGIPITHSVQDAYQTTASVQCSALYCSSFALVTKKLAGLQCSALQQLFPW